MKLKIKYIAENNSTFEGTGVARCGALGGDVRKADVGGQTWEEPLLSCPLFGAQQNNNL